MDMLVLHKHPSDAVIVLTVVWYTGLELAGARDITGGASAD